MPIRSIQCRGRAVEPFRKLAGAHDDARPPGPCLTGSTTVPYDGALGFFKSATTARSLRGSCWLAAQLGDSAGERIPTGIQGREKPGPEKGTPPLRTGDNSQGLERARRLPRPESRLLMETCAGTRSYATGPPARDLHGMCSPGVVGAKEERR